MTVSYLRLVWHQIDELFNMFNSNLSKLLDEIDRIYASNTSLLKFFNLLFSKNPLSLEEGPFSPVFHQCRTICYVSNYSVNCVKLLATLAPHNLQKYLNFKLNSTILEMHLPNLFI